MCAKEWIGNRSRPRLVTMINRRSGLQWGGNINHHSPPEIKTKQQLTPYNIICLFLEPCSCSGWRALGSVMDRPCQVIRLNAHLDDDNWKFVRSDFPGLRKEDAGWMDGQGSEGSPDLDKLCTEALLCFSAWTVPIWWWWWGWLSGNRTTDNCCNIIPRRSALRFHHGKLSWAKLLLLWSAKSLRRENKITLLLHRLWINVRILLYAHDNKNHTLIHCCVEARMSFLMVAPTVASGFNGDI